MWAEGVLSLCADWLTAACQSKLGDASVKDCSFEGWSNATTISPTTLTDHTFIITVTHNHSCSSDNVLSWHVRPVKDLVAGCFNCSVKERQLSLRI